MPIQVNPVNRKHLRLVFARINDLESRHSSVERDKLRELYSLAWRLITNGGELTKEEILSHKLDKYQGREG